ncbi:MAG: hypothetical protein ACYS0I_06490 [Planctomycetota bacterium]|jgi:hypothetical protein
MKAKILNYAIVLPVLGLASILCCLLVFRFHSFLTLFLPVAMVLLVLFLFFRVRLFSFHIAESLSLAVLFYCIGMFIFGQFCWLMASLNLRLFSSKMRFPLNGIEWISKGPEDSFYCLSYMYSRVQVFDSKGELIKGWFVRIPFGEYQIALTQDGGVILGKGGTAYYVYDQYGNRIAANKKSNSILTSVPSTRSTRAVDQQGNSYKLVSMLRPRIVKVSESGNESTLIKDPVGLWFHTFPLPFVAFLLLSLLIYITLSMPKQMRWGCGGG